MSKVGDGFCAKCDYFVTLQLTGKNHSDGARGLWWECVPDQPCPSCGTILEWLHEPAGNELLVTSPVVVQLVDTEGRTNDPER